MPPPIILAAEIETDTLAPLADIPLSWLASLEAWLGVESLTDVIAIPIRLLALLFRALLSAGSGLVAPASILTAIAFGARRKLVPTVG